MADGLELRRAPCIDVSTDFNSATNDIIQIESNEAVRSLDIPTLPHNKDNHLFICYIQDNASEVRTIVDNLEREGLKCCYHERDFLPGQQVIGNIHEAIEKSMSILVVLSENFVQSRFCLHEIEQALHARISQGYNVIPIKIEPCNVPVSLENITFIDAENVPVGEMHRKIQDAFLHTGKS